MNSIVLDRFSTLDHPGPVRLECWNRYIGQLFDGMTVAANAALDAAWLQYRIGDIGVASARSEKALIDRFSDQPLGQSDRLLFHLQHRGRSLNTQGQASVMLSPGDLTLVQSDRPYSISISDRNHMFVIDCPLENLRLTHDKIQYNNIHKIDANEFSAKILRDFVSLILNRTSDVDLGGEDQQALSDVLLRLIGRCLAAPASAREKPDLGARERIMAFIERSLAEPGLRTGMIADALSVSPRTVQDVFAEMATTPTAYIQGRRLTAAAERLDQPDRFGGVTDLAFDLGFSDSAYFCRCFKARFGLSPSAYRRRPKG